MRPTINSEKHFQPISLFTVDENTVTSSPILTAVQNASTSNQVRVGAVVKAIWVELWYLGSSAQPIVQISTVEKIVGDGDTITSAQMSDLHNYPNKKNILKTSQGLVGDSNTSAVPVFREWIPIPKGKQRMGLGDTIYMNVACRGEANNDLEICGMFIFKEYF